MDMVELLGDREEQTESIQISNDTSFGKLYHIIEKKFPLGSFRSTDILEAYEDEYRQPIRLSTISTYLSRLQQKQLLTRERTPSGHIYRRLRIKPTQM
jgi:predicted transcriptional regulator